MRVELRLPDRLLDGLVDLREREVERVFQHYDLGLVGRDPCEAARELRAKLGEARLTLRIGIVRDALVLVKRLAAAHALARADVAAGVDHEAVEPRRELRLATELADPDAELGERFLSGVASVLRVGEQVPGKALHLRRVTFAQRLERTLVAVLSSLDHDRLAQPLVDEPPL